MLRRTRSLKDLRRWLLGGVRRPPAAVRAAAGTAAAPRRRATVLVIVLGALALISVITIVYVIVGQSDRRSAAVTTQRVSVDNVVQGVRDYLAQVIADDTVSVYVDGYEPSATNPADAVPRLVRKAATFPFVDPARRSVLGVPGSTVGDLSRRFDPTGSFSDAWPATVSGAARPVPDPRLPATPFLATTAPEWLRQGLTADPPEEGWRLHRDWRQISIFAPDGRFVNLWNLAPSVTVNGQRVRVSAFNARSAMRINPATLAGNPRAPQVDSADPTNRTWLTELSYGLTLPEIDANPPRSQEFIPNQPQVRVDPLNPTTTLPADPNVPAHWATNLVDAVRPLRDVAFGPDRPEYTPYQWADTDGDGLVDARWFELTDATDPNNVRALLPRDGRFRWFVAARAVDLSGKVNVATASEFVSAPRPTTGPAQATPAGFSPADVDLLRLLTGDDVARQYPTMPGPGAPQAASYASLRQPQPAGGGGTADYSSYDAVASVRIGELSYAALVRSRARDRVQVPPQNQPVISGALPPIAADTRFSLFQAVGRQPSGAFAQVGVGASGIVTSAMPGMADMLELLTFRGINNPRESSRLEQILDGRLVAGTGPLPPGVNALQALGFGPMRSNRPLALEHPVDIERGSPGVLNVVGDGRVDDNVWARLAVDVRQHLTTTSGARLLRPGPIAARDQSVLTVSRDAKIDAVGALTAAGTGPAPGSRDPSLLFEIYAQTLAPSITRTVASAAGQPASVWDIAYPFPTGAVPASLGAVPTPEAAATLHYGGNRGRVARWGPELAVRLAAQMTANMVDAFDRDDEPSGFTLLLDAAVDGGQSILGAQSIVGDSFRFPWWNITGPGGVFPGRLNLGPAALPNTGAGGADPSNPIPTAARAGAINVFGIEPQPVITQVALTTIYRDSGPLPLPPGSQVVVRGDAADDNDEYVGQILYIQLANPFDTPVVLSSPEQTGNAESWTTFYVEFNGRLFKLAQWDDAANTFTPITLQAGQTRTFYVLSFSRSEFNDRLNGGSGGPDQIGPIVRAQADVISPAGARVPPVQLAPMNGEISPPSGFLFSATTPATLPTDFVTDLLDHPTLPPATPEERDAQSYVALWRTMRVDAAENPGTTNHTRNFRRNDILADILRDPRAFGTGGRSRPVLDRRLESGQNQIVGAIVPLGGGSFDTGIAFALTGSMKRRDSGPSLPRGTMPAYALEGKWSGGLTNVDQVFPPGSEAGNGGVNTTVAGVLQASNSGATLAGLVTVLRDAAAPQVSTLKQEADAKTGDPIASNLDGRPFARLYTEVLANLGPARESFFTPSAVLGSSVLTLRVQDLLSVLAVGPQYDPPVQRPTGVLDVVPDVNRWITLPQSLALALNYSSPPDADGGGASSPSQTTDPDFTIYARLGDFRYAPPVPGGAASGTNNGRPLVGAVDRGFLILDRFAPFEDRLVNGVFDQGGQAVDQKRFPGIPLALHIFNVADTRFSGASALTTPLPGLVNVNTAPLPVLRLVPMLSPTTLTTSDGRAVWPDFVAQAVGGAPTRTLPAQNADVAASLAAYRDKQVVFSRDGSRPPAERVSAFTQVSAIPAPPPGGTTYLEGPGGWDGRAETTGIQSIREQPGLMGVGEILAVIDRQPDRTPINPYGHSPSTPGSFRIPLLDRVDALSIDGDPSGWLGTNTNQLLSVRGDTTSTRIPSAIPDAWSDRLVAASAALNTTTTRSDVFAVWFVLHGYQRSDTENLRLADPLTPSVARRFVMVVNRSNVTRRGEPPKIVLFAELPYQAVP